jgi:hypothetical protein
MQRFVEQRGQSVGGEIAQRGRLVMLDASDQVELAANGRSATRSRLDLDPQAGIGGERIGEFGEFGGPGVLDVIVRNGKVAGAGACATGNVRWGART